MRTAFLSAVTLSLAIAAPSFAADWPQWRGPNRDAKATGFAAPVAWPKELTQKWRVNVGDGAATPALVGERLYVFTREGGDEIVRCLDATTGKEVWQEKYAARGANDPGGFVGPRSSPAVAAGKVVTVGALGILSCFDAASGKKLWSKDDFRSWPQFCAASSPVIVDGMCIAQLGGDNGAVVAYDLVTGTEKWKVAELPTAYASPVLMTVSGMKLIVGQVSDGIVAINVADGNKVWEKFFDRGGSRYRAATPIVDGDTLIYLDGPAKAVKLEKQGDKFVDTDVWTNMEIRVEFNTPILRSGLLVGLTGPTGSGAHQFFCLNHQTGKTVWTAPAPRMEGGAAGAADAKGGGKGAFGKGGGGKGGFGGGMRADAGYGSIVDAGSVLLALTPSSDLLVIEPSDKEFKQLASYKVAAGGTYAYPVVSGNRIYVKDRDSVTLWTIE